MKAGIGIVNKAFSKVVKVMLSPGVPLMFVDEAFHKRESVTFLDCREKKEYEVSHVPEAVWVGYDDFELSRLQNIGKSMTLVLYCSVGKRSDIIAKKLIAANYKDVANMPGGIFEWVNQGYAIHSESRQTNVVHGYNCIWGSWLKRGHKVY